MRVSKAEAQPDEDRPPVLVSEPTQEMKIESVAAPSQQSTKQHEDKKKISIKINPNELVIPSFDMIQAKKQQGQTATLQASKTTEVPPQNDDDATKTAQLQKMLPMPPPMTVASNRYQSRPQQPEPLYQEQAAIAQHATQPNVLAVVSQKVVTKEDQNSMLGKRVEVDGCGYRLIKEIGRGGTSTVYCALREDNVNHKDSLVALKHVIGTENVHALREEIELLTKLRNNPYVIQYIGHDISAGSIGVLVMELGQTDISSCITELSTNKMTGKKDIRLQRNTIRYFFQGMVEAVQAIHNCRIVHGDLKPANFVFVRGRIKLIDFGIAKSIREDTINITRDNQTGTMNYIPPEALKATKSMQYKLSRKADVWSLGCILYSLVYGHPPFHDITNIVSKMYAITSPDHEIDYPDPGGDASDRYLLDAMRSCLQRDVDKRISTEGLLAHPFLSSSAESAASSDQVSPKLFYTSILEMTKRAGEISAIVGTATAKVNGFAKEYAKSVLQHPDQIAESLSYALDLVEAHFPRKAFATIPADVVPPTPMVALDKENVHAVARALKPRSAVTSQ